MSKLGSTTYTAVVWTAGDTITEAKMDNMTANDQAYDSHAAEGIQLNNNIALAGKNTSGSIYDIVNLSSGDVIEIGDTTLAGNLKILNGIYQTPETYTPADTASEELDLQVSNEHRVTIAAGNGDEATLTVENEVNGQRFVVSILQGAGGNGTINWFTTIRWADGVEPTLTTTADKRDTFGFIVTGADQYDGFIVGQNI